MIVIRRLSYTILSNQWSVRKSNRVELVGPFESVVTRKQRVRRKRPNWIEKIVWLCPAVILT